MATLVAYPQTLPPPGPGLYFFLVTFAWPLVVAPTLLGLQRGPASVALRLLEVPLLAWTSFLALFAAGMDPSPASYVLVAGAALYAIGAAWSDLMAWRGRSSEGAA